MAKALASNALTILVLALVATAGLLAWAQREFRAEGPLAQAICLQVPPGATMGRVSEALVDQGAISHPVLFRLGADYTDRAELLKAGSYLVEPGASMGEIIAEITGTGRSTCGTEVNYRIGVVDAETVVRELDPETQRYEEVAEFAPGVDPLPDAYLRVLDAPGTRFRVTVAEGTTVWQVVDALGRLDFMSGDPGDLPPEGWLAPDSYEVRRGDDKAALIAEMRSRQERIVAEIWANRAPDIPIDSPEEALILASIIEKETGIAGERGTVASVFVNRLREGMRLQTDPTVIYGVTEGRGVLGRGIRQSELRRATPWNTYVIEGLPPTPIANPGRAALQAAVRPDDTPYLFFVADGTGGHAFATTLQEHNRNVARWREIEAERAVD
jgi:UPF0755 protein